MRQIGIFLGAEPSGGGLFQYTESLLDALRVLSVTGWDVTAAHVSPTWEPILDAYPFNRVCVEGGTQGMRLSTALLLARVPGPLARAILSAASSLPRRLAGLNRDIWIFPAQDALAYQCRVPVLGTVHDLMHRYESSFPEVSTFGRRSIRDHRFRSMLTWARGVLVDSDVGRRQVIESYGTDARKIFPLPYVPPANIYQADPADFDQRYSLPPKFIFYPAQFWAHKNHKRLVSAAAELVGRLSDLTLVFTGGAAHEFDAVMAHAAALGVSKRIVCPGYVPAAYLPGFYRRARAMVMPTFFGPTNIPPLEAFALDCPVAVSNIYGMPEQVGEAALRFDPKSVTEIAAALERLWNEDALCRQLAARGRERLAEWGPSQFATRLCEILERVA